MSNPSNSISHNPHAYTHPNPPRLKVEERESSYRSEFAIDRDRILYSGAYRRYQGKTQVFPFANLFDEEMTNRSLHTTYVSQIGRTIGKALGLNLELIEAIALGHDLGHAPFGHIGGRVLNDLCKKHNIGGFSHSLQSLHIVDNISNRGVGLNLTLPTRDGILFHDGDMKHRVLTPAKKPTLQEFEKLIEGSNFNKKQIENFPFTYEGCVVRQADTIAYLGQDFEDALRLGILRRDDIPREISKHLGTTNSQIVSKLVKSIIQTSMGQEFIALEKTSFEVMSALREFNYKKIYSQRDNILQKIKRGMRILFETYLEDLEKTNGNSKIFKHFLNKKSNKYIDRFNNCQKVRDFISTMTDRYFNQELKDLIVLYNF